VREEEGMSARLRLAVSMLGAACFLAIAGVSAASPPSKNSFEVHFVDSQLCTFPLGVDVIGKSDDHVKLAQGAELFTGATKFTLRNLDTGATAGLTTSGSTYWDYSGGTVSFRGGQLVGMIPFASFTGNIRVSLDDFTVMSQAGTKGVVDPCALVGGPPAVPRTTPAPWPAPLNVLGGIKLAGLTPLLFGLAMHTHTHLDVIVNGSPVTVPAGIGIVEPVEFAPGEGLESAIGALSPLHTHFDDGILHVEADTGPFTLTLGQVFDEWQVRLTSSCLGSYCTGGGSSLRVYVNGTQVSGDPRAVVLSNCAEIAVVFGPAGVPASPPSSFAWDPIYC
jgi:hypothetical protein